MFKKTLLMTAVGALATVGGKLALLTGSQNAPEQAITAADEPELTASCPYCGPPPDCFPGDPCSNCG